jgi:hypothetical protein
VIILEYVTFSGGKSAVPANSMDNKIMYITVNDRAIAFLTSPLLNLVPKSYFEKSTNGIIKLNMPIMQIIRNLQNSVIVSLPPF